MDYTQSTYQDDVTAARTAYDSLATQAQKDLVTNYTDLEAAEAGIVTDEPSLTSAIANASKIFIVNGFDLTAPVVVNQTVSINGNGNTLKAPNAFAAGLSHNSAIVIQANNVEVSTLTVNANSAAPGTWGTPARFGMQVYNATGVKLTAITLENGQAGLLVNAKEGHASVIANGIRTIGNGFGGIEVFAEANFTSTLDLTGSTHEDATGKPAIWSEGAGSEVVNAPGYSAVDGDATPPANGSVPSGKIYYTK